MKMFLNGTAMSGQADHVHLQGAPLIGAATTAARYRFYAVRGEFPGLVPATDGTGGAVQGELYEIPEDVWQRSLAPAEPSELDLGEIQLDDGSTVFALVLDLRRVSPDDVEDITEFGGWRAYLEGVGAAVPAVRTS